MVRPRKRAVVVSPAAMGLRALTGVALIALLHPSLQFPLVRSSGAQRAGPHDGDATSVPGKLVASDNTTTPLQHAGPLSPPPPARPAPKHARSSSFPPESADTVSIPPPAHTRPANPGKTNRGANFRTRHRFGETPGETLGKASAEGVVVTRGGVEGSTKQRAAVITDGGEGRYSHSVSDESPDPQDPFSPVAPHHLDVPFTEVVQVDLHSRLTPGVDNPPVKPGGESRGGGGGERKALSRTAQGGSREDVVPVGEEEEKEGEEEGDRQLLQQPVPHRTADPHESKMVLTAVGSFTAIVGVCVMAAIFQCCCRRKRSGSRDGSQEQEEKQGLDHKNSSSRSSRSSKSPSPHIVFTKDEDEENDRGQAETDTLLDEDKDLGDFSAVQRETSILRSYRKAPPPKNRARASRVPRALKAVNQKASPNIFQELVDSEQKYDDTSKTPPAATNGLASPETSDMQSSMLADIDSTLAALHTVQDTSPARSADRSREASAEKQLLTKPGSAESQLKPASPTEQPLPKSSSKEQLAKALAQELSRSVSKEMLSKPHSKPVTPKSSKDTTPKSQSAGASPKTVHSDRPSASSSKDSMGSSSASDNGAGKSGSSAGEGDNHNNTNFFALIDPTAKDKGSEAGGKSKIPVRAASSPTQPTAPLRLSAGRDKRFPVPSVHGDQMDQLMKSLKTRLKDDDNASPKQTTDAVSPKEGSLHDDDTDPQGRDRSHSDPTKQRDDRGRTLQQTHL